MGPSLVVALTTLGLGVSAAMGTVRLMVLVGAVLLGQLSIGWSNDWLDAVGGHDQLRTDKPVATGLVAIPTVRRAAISSVIGALLLSLTLGPAMTLTHAVAIALAWAYNARLKHTVMSVVPYIVSFGLLPSIVTTAAGHGIAPAWASLTGACFGAGVHLANVLPDLQVDAAAGVRGLPQRLGAGHSVAATVALLGLGTLAVVWGPGSGVGVPPVVVGGALVAGALLVLLAILGATGRAEPAYRTAMACGLVVVGMLVARGDVLS